MNSAMYEAPDGLWRPVPTPRRLTEVIRDAMLNALAWSQGDQKKAALALGISPRKMNYQMKKHRIPRALAS